jgi:hypothetical protein
VSGFYILGGEQGEEHSPRGVETGVECFEENRGVRLFEYIIAE